MERRQERDFWSKLLFYLNIIAWILIFFIMFVFHLAQPEFETLFDRFYHLKLRTDWDLQYLFYLIYIVIAGIAISLTGLSLSFIRGRRNSDHNKALIITGILSIIMLAISISVL